MGSFGFIWFGDLIRLWGLLGFGVARSGWLGLMVWSDLVPLCGFGFSIWEVWFCAYWIWLVVCLSLWVSNFRFSCCGLCLGAAGVYFALDWLRSGFLVLVGVVYRFVVCFAGGFRILV